MRTLIALLLIVSFLALAEQSARAQRPTQVPRIGILGSGPAFVAEFLQELRQLGYIEGKNIIVEYRFPKGNIELLPELAADLVRLKVSVIVASSPTASGPAIKATKTIPIVMVGGGDPVSRGFVESLSLPGGNVTGLSSDARGLDGKRLELLKETFPGIARVALLNPRRRKVSVDNYALAAKELGVDLETVDVQSPAEFARAFSKITLMSSDALITMREVLSIRHAQQITEFALKKRLPAMYESEEFVKAGGLMSYGVNYRALWRRAAVYVDKILKGANPAVLPVEPPQFEFVINLQTAKKIGRTIPPEILLEANEVIK
ncbi:MAG TPA: ABC transporter substrate-binding protein [Candidatus Binatia bacterium]|jgi:putative ABC transport system substrate-binding protein|nr:ABC transporter substrate-binding protein [Candidatus Binatia bacterium]